jgi:hypothetical protein
MRRLIFSIAMALISPIITGCSTSATVSQYAGLPRHLLPKDHLDYRPLNSAHAHYLTKVSSASATPDGNAIDKFALDEENIRLAKAMTICRHCMPSNMPSPSYDSAESLQAHEAAIARALLEIQARH